METTWEVFNALTQCLFKSYYVVWKPRPFSEEQASHDRFKSYYVVWKPIVAKHQIMGRSSLNRTMQYGNKYLKLSDENEE